MRLKTLMLCLYIFCCSSFAQPSPPVKMFGRIDCGEWLNPRSDIQGLTNKYWLMGYLTGINTMLMSPALDIGNVLGRLNSSQQAFAWMDKYCRDNPLLTPDLGGLTLMNELKK